MKKMILVALFGFLVASLRAQVSDSNTPPYLSKSFANQSIANVHCETSGGSIEVTGGSESRVDMYVRSSNDGWKNSLSNDEIRQRIAADYDVTISLDGTKLTAIAKPKDDHINWKRSLSISFKIYVPQQVSTDLSTSGGSIHLTNLSGSQDFGTSGGSLHVDQVTGKIRGRTSGGSIHVSNSKDDVDLSTSGGSIDASNCSGKIQLNTSGGSLKLNDLQGTITATTSGGSIHGSNVGGELAAHTSGGSVTLTALSCSLETSTSGGNINVEIDQLGKYVKINNSGGHVDLQVPANKGLDLKLYGSKIKTDDLKNFSGSTHEDEMVGQLNGGGVPISVDAGSGKINLSFK
jgi:DUF4097 and DUF4098 domain-containing protein YvlB